MPESVDVLFTNALVLTMDHELHQYEPGALAVRGDQIIAVGPEVEIRSSYTAQESIDCDGKVLMRDRKMLTLDARKVLEAAEDVGRELLGG